MSNLSESDIPQANVSPPLPVKHGRPLVKILMGLILLPIGVGIGWFLANNRNNIYLFPEQAISSYDDCIKAKGSVIQESYPATCVTRGGIRYAQLLTDEEKQNLLPPDSSANWKEFADPTGKFTFKYPKDLILKDQNSEPDTSEYTQLFRVFNTFMDTNAPSFVVRVRSGLNAQQLEKEDFNDMEGHVDYKIIKREVISLSGKPAVKVNVFVGPEEDYQEDSSSVYIYSDIDPQESLSIRQLGADRVQFDQILSTFEFTNNTSTNSIDTINWKTYRNNKCKYQMKYPPEWKIFPEDERAIYGATILFAYEVGSGVKSPDDWVKVQIGCGSVTAGLSQAKMVDQLNSRDSGYGVPKVESFGTTIINGKIAYKQIMTAPVGDPVLEYIIFKDNSSFVDIGFTPSTTKLTEEIQQILSTFKFLDD